MTAFALRTRRMVLRDMGKAGLAVMILGTAACASEATENATPTPQTSGDTSNDPVFELGVGCGRGIDLVESACRPEPRVASGRSRIRLRLSRLPLR